MADALYVNGRGEVVAIEPGTAAEDRAWRLGWAPASVEQARDYYLTQQYSSGGQAVVAGLEAAGRMVTLGGLTHLETALGMSPEAIARREAANPLAAELGAGLGVIVPLLATGGASGAAQAGAGGLRGALAATGPSLLARAGTAATRVAAEALPAGASVATRVAAKGLAAAAGGAVEGAGYEVGQMVHEAALGEPSFAAEAALSRLGMAAATFGALAGGGGILGQLTKEGVGAGRRALEGRGDLGAKLGEWLEDVEARSAQKAAGAIQSDIAKAEKRIGPERLRDIALEMRERGILQGPLDTPGKVLERAEAIKDASVIGELLREADAASPGRMLGDLPAVVQRARKEIFEPLSRNPLEASAARRLGEVLDQYETMGAQTLEGLHGIRRQVDAKVFGVGDPDATALRRSFRRMRRLLSEELDAGIQRQGNAETRRRMRRAGRDIQAAWKEANRTYEVASQAADFARAGIRRAQGNNLVSPTEFLSVLGGGLGAGPVGGVAGGITTALIRRQGSATLGWLSNKLRTTLTQRGQRLAAATAGGLAADRRAGVAGAFEAATSAPETAAALSVLEEAQESTRTGIRDALRRILKAAPGAAGRAVAAYLSKQTPEDVRRLVSSPEAMLDALHAQVDDVQPHAAAVAQAAQLASVRAATFLASKAPRTSLPGLLAPRAVVAPSEMAKFRRYAEVVEDPQSALRHAERGTLAPEHVEALASVWPAFHDEVRRIALWEMMENRGAVSPRSRFMLSLLTGIQLDGSLSSVLRHQVANQQPSRRPDAAQPANRDAEKLSLGARSQTPAQKRQERSA